MIIYKLPNAAASKITVTDTATNLFDLIETAAGTTPDIPGDANAIMLTAESDDVRIMLDDNSPTSGNGFLIKGDVPEILRGVPLRKMQLIRVGSSNVDVSIQVGKVDL